MKIEEMIRGNVYAATHCSSMYIFYYAGSDNINENELAYKGIMSRNTFFNGAGSTARFMGDQRNATQEEINHLDACIKAGKWVECPKEPNFDDYQLTF